MAQFDYMLLRRSILSEEKNEQRQEEIQKRKARRGLFITDDRTIASLFTGEELEEPTLAPVKEMAAIEQAIDFTVAEIKMICTEISFDEFIKKLFRRDRSSQDLSDYLDYQNQIEARLREKDVARESSSSKKAAATRRQKTSNRDVELALEYVRNREPKGSSNTGYMKRIGKHHNLSPNWSVEVVQRGLERLGIPIAGHWDDCNRFQEQNRDALLAYWDSRDKPGNRCAALVQLMRQLKLA